MSEYIPDNYDFYAKKATEEAIWLESRPICSKCGEHIQDDYLYNIEGKELCQECLDELYREWIDD